MRHSKGAGTSRSRLPGSRRRPLAIAAVCGLLGLLVAACSGAAANTGHGKRSAASAPARPAAQIKITPASGTLHARPNLGVGVTVTTGKLRSVTVTHGHGADPGTLSTNGTSWHTVWPLHTGTRYTVTATAVGTDGKTVTTTSTFRTLNPQATLSAQTLLGYNQTYGVGIPIMITFSSPVTRRAAVERAIRVTTSKPVVGAWMWDGSQALDFRPRDYWPPHTRVSFDAHFNGVEAAPGVYMTADLSQSFRIGDSLIGVTNTRTHHSRVYYRGKLFGVWPDSSGMPGDDTANGAYLTIEKGNPVLMTGPGYKNVPVYYSVRFTWSGNYWHYAPWSIGEQGFVNVSHGCVNLNYPHATWYYYHAVPGDPITVVGSPVAGRWDDGYTEWFLSFRQVLARSATHLAVKAGPAGSTFVSPATLPPPPPSSVLNGSRPGNFLAG